MNDDIRTELARAHVEADRQTDLGDKYANEQEYRLAAIAYSRAAGILLAAVDHVLTESEVAAA